MTKWHSHRCDNRCQTVGCYFHPNMGTQERGLDVDHPITIRTFVERFGCGRYTPIETYEDAHLAGFQNGYEEGFEIGKAQCETHHDEMLWKERERVLNIAMGLIKHEGFLDIGYDDPIVLIPDIERCFNAIRIVDGKGGDKK